MKSRKQSTAVRAGGQRVRITGGAWRSRVLDFPQVPGLRPTPDRVRQALFNWLGQELSGRICLDLFAGSGALGFDALSRNAARVVMVEQDPQVRAALAASARALDAGTRLVLRVMTRCSSCVTRLSVSTWSSSTLHSTRGGSPSCCRTFRAS